jgi:hypothetical protein
MSKRVLMIGIAVGAGLAALRGGTAEAGNWAYLRPPGTWFYYGSIDGCAAIGSVPNPDNHPAQLSCEFEITEVATLCQNPQNHDVNPGKAATKVFFTGKHQLEQSDMVTKTKGKANACVKVDEMADGSPLLDDGLCVNPNWHLLGALTTQFQAICRTEQCTGTDNPNTTDVNEACNTTVVKDTQRCQCTLPAEFSVDNPPTPCPDPLHPELYPTQCTAYQCIEVNASGVPTGGLCQLN